MVHNSKNEHALSFFIDTIGHDVRGSFNDEFSTFLSSSRATDPWLILQQIRLLEDTLRNLNGSLRTFLADVRD